MQQFMGGSCRPWVNPLGEYTSNSKPADPGLYLWLTL